MGKLVFGLLAGWALSTFLGHETLGGASPVRPRVVGGRETERGEFPFMLRLPDADEGCGAVLISPTCALTTARCVESGPWQSLIAGDWKLEEDEDSEQRRDACATRHPGYNSVTGENDIAFLRASSFETINNSYVRPIQLPERGARLEGYATVMGWGETGGSGSSSREQSNVLQKATVSILTDEECRRSHGSKQIKDSMVCTGSLGAGRVGTSKGDFGGPMIAYTDDGTPILVGLTSWGDSCVEDELAGVGVHTEVSHFMEWVQGHLDRNSSFCPRNFP